MPQSANVWTKRIFVRLVERWNVTIESRMLEYLTNGERFHRSSSNYGRLQSGTKFSRNIRSLPITISKDELTNIGRYVILLRHLLVRVMSRYTGGAASVVLSQMMSHVSANRGTGCRRCCLRHLATWKLPATCILSLFRDRIHESKQGNTVYSQPAWARLRLENAARLPPAAFSESVPIRLLELPAAAVPLILAHHRSCRRCYPSSLPPPETPSPPAINSATLNSANLSQIIRKVEVSSSNYAWEIVTRVLRRYSLEECVLDRDWN